MQAVMLASAALAAALVGSSALARAVPTARLTAADGRVPGSVLIYPVHRSGTGFTIISVTNVAKVGPGPSSTDVRFNYVNVVPNPLDPFRPLECFVSDRQESLTPADTLSVLTACHNAAGNNEGYVLVSAQDPSEADTNWSHDFLVGSELVITAFGAVYSIEAIPFRSPLDAGTDTDLDGDDEIDFDGMEYEGVPRPIYIDSFVAAAGSSLALLNLTGGVNHVVSLKIDIFNDNEFQLSATRDFKCWFEEPLNVVSPVFNELFLALNTPNDPHELDLSCDGNDDLETGWAIVCADIACSPAQCCPEPALLGAITAGPAAMGNIDGGRLLWESTERTFTGDFLKFGNVDPECEPCPPEESPTCAFSIVGPAIDGQPVMFDASASMAAPGSSIVEYCWNFGGGTGTICTPSPTIMHTFVCPSCPSQQCEFDVSLTVKDDSGCTKTCESFTALQVLCACGTCSLEIVATDPPAPFGSNLATVPLCTTVTFDVSGSVPPVGSNVLQLLFDPDGDGLDVDPNKPGVIAAPAGTTTFQHTYDGFVSADGDASFVPTFEMVLDVVPPQCEIPICSVIVDVVRTPGLIFLSGDDADDHCDSLNPAPDKNCLHYPAGILSFGMSHSNLGCASDLKLLAIGVNGAQALQALTRWVEDAPNGPEALLGPVQIDFANDAATIGNVDFGQYRMVYVPSVEKDDGGEVVGGITLDQLMHLQTRRADLEEYLYEVGGALYSQTQSIQEGGMTPWSWLPQAYIDDLTPAELPGFFDFDIGLQDTFQDNCEVNLAEAGDALVPSLILPLGLSQSDLDLFISHEEWHNTFVSPSFDFGLEPLPGAVMNGSGVRLVVRDFDQGNGKDCLPNDASLIGGFVRPLGP